LTALLVAMGCYFLLCLRLTWFAEWYWNANSDRLYAAVAAYSEQYGIRRIGTNWRYPFVLDYYRERSGRETLDEIRLENPIPLGRSLYVLFPREDASFLERERLQVVYRDPLSDTVVALAPCVAAPASCVGEVERARPDGTDGPVGQGAQYVIRPGAAALFADMLGKGEALPGGCTLSSGEIEPASLLARYVCGAAEVVLQVVHPETARPADVRTQRFAIAVKDGAPPAGLLDAVADRIRARESHFEWASARGSGTRAAHE